MQAEVIGRIDGERLLAEMDRVLEQVAEPSTLARATDRAHAYMALGRPAAALEQLLSEGAIDADEENAARQLILTWTQSDEFAAASGQLLSSVAKTLGADRTSNLIATRLVELATERATIDLDQAVELLECLDRLGRHQDAARLTASWIEQSPTLRESARWCSAAARASLGARDARMADSLLGRAVALWRSKRESRTGLAWIDLLATRAHRSLLRARHRYALRLLRQATVLSSGGGHSPTTARLLNNIGILEYEQGDFQRSAETLQTSLDIRSRLGDIRGCVSTSYNLSRALLAMGDVTGASARLQKAAALALRHGLLEPLAAILKQLGDVYDSQLNADLALESLERSLLTATRAGSAYRTASAAWALAPLASAMGRSQLARDALRHSARLARARTLSQARHLHRAARCSSLLHAGQHARARGTLASISRQLPPSLDVEGQVALHLCAAALGQSATELMRPSRPRREDRRQRNAYRTWLRYQALANKTGSERFAALASFQVPTPGLHEGTSAPLRRVAWEAILSRALAQVDGRGTDPFGVIARYAKHAGERLLFARATCARALLPNGPLAERGRHFSDAVVSLSALPGETGMRNQGIPREFRLAYSALDVRSSGPRVVRQVEDLQALAHRLLSMFGEVRHADERLTRALRQVLHASAELDATGDVKELFRSVTRLTIDVTGAERALVAVPSAEEATRRPSAFRRASAIASTAARQVKQSSIVRSPFVSPFCSTTSTATRS
ncbi:MAG: tetratricopeptide repeat protein [Planctomycetota bacterium]